MDYNIDCPYADENPHGYQRVMIFGDSKQFCEVGHNCVKRCEFSYTDADQEAVDAATREAFPEMYEEQPQD